MKTILTFTILLLNFQTGMSAETDTFTDRYIPISDSAETLNTQANESIRTSLIKVNRSGQGCVEKNLYKELRTHFGNHTNTTFVEDFISSPGADVRSIKLEASVYQIWSAWDGLGMGWSVARKTGLTMSPVVNIGDQLIGTDKLEHMFGQGYLYFNRNYLNEKGLVKAVKRGIGSEKTILGGNKIGNGVFSYGDLSANFNGMRFWNHMLLLRPDILGEEHSQGPYIVCQNNKWIQKNPIDFRNYIDASMDEAINCSKFPTEKTTVKFTTQLKLMGMNCPLVPEKLKEMNSKYGKMAKWIINLKGTGAVSYFKEFRKD